MSNDHSDNNEPSRRSSGLFDVPAEPEIKSEHKRNTGIFTPDTEGTLTDVPEAITAGERLPHLSEYEGIRLESLPVKGLKKFLYGLGVLVLIIAGAEAYSVYQYAVELHWLAAGAYLSLLLVVTGLGLRTLWSYLRDPDNLSALDEIQLQAGRLQEGQDFGNSKPFIEKLEGFYTSKPHAVYFKRCLDQLPDYNNDRETIDHIERVFLEPLDNEAIRRISNHCLKTGTVVAVSPWAALDMLLSLWRSLKMVDEISEVYGLRPSMPNRLKLIKSIIGQMVFVGASEVVIDAAMEELGSQTLASMASARIGQGIGAGIYTARIGIATMRVTRPIAYSEEKLPRTTMLIGPMLTSLKNLVGNIGS